MTYGGVEASDAFASIAKGSASFQARADLENHLAWVLRTGGPEGVWDLLRSLPDYDFAAATGLPQHEARFVASYTNDPRIVVATFLGPHSSSVNVTAEPATSSAAEPDSRHRTFYEIWESLLGLPESAVSKLDPRRKAVFLVALLEAEVMNGGLGQYLSNTDGTHLEATIGWLGEIGATKTASILTRAAALAADHGSFLAAWESNAREFELLDDEFMDADEDLAGLTVDALPK